MKTLLRPLLQLALWPAAALSFIIPQQSLGQIEVIDDALELLKVPGNNNATYGPVPQEEQLFTIEFLDITSSPIPVDRIFFVLVRGAVHYDANITDDLLTNATLSITRSVVHEEGKSVDPETYTVPLRTTAFNRLAHLSIRDENGAWVDYLTLGDTNDVLADFYMWGSGHRRGTWTFEIVTRLGDGRCLFAFSLTQWLEEPPRH